MSSYLQKIRNILTVTTVTTLALFGSYSSAQAQIEVITVDCTPMVSPGPTSFGASNTMGMSLQMVDQGSDFNVTEVTPAAFRAMTVAQLSAYNLIAINNHPSRIDCGAGLGLGTTWHNAVGVLIGGRVVLTSHDAARFKIIIQPGTAFFGAGAPGPGVEPFGADELVRQAALWAGGGTNSTGLLIFNDSARFFTVGGIGWDNTELNLPPAWGISDLDQTGGAATDGGHTDILPAYTGHPIYTGLSDTRFGVDSLSSFAANIADGSFHSVFATYNGSIFTPTELIINTGIIDVGGFNAAHPGIGAWNSPFGPDGSAITLIRDEGDLEPPVVACLETVNPHGKNIPRAGQKSPGQNEDGFYQLRAVDNMDPDPQIFVSDVNGSGPFGPFSAGDNIKLTEAPGTTPGMKSMGSSNGQAGAVMAHIKLTGDAVITALDAAGNSASTMCLVPPPPK